jgi:GNAT superfamily N-acetyltransferase
MQIARVRGKEAKIAALDKAMECELYSPRGIFIHLLPFLRARTSFIDISVASVEEKLIGIALYFKEHENHYRIEKGTTSLYVNPNYRRQKVGTKLVQTFKWKKFRRAYLGDHGSREFFDSQKIPTDWY